MTARIELINFGNVNENTYFIHIAFAVSSFSDPLYIRS